jgi:2-alkyl-3-oxoalkanoate reductase
MLIGVVGANGFVGRRTVEMLHSQHHLVRPIVRNAKNLDYFALMNVGGYVANAFDQADLEKAFRGCDVVIHSVLGSPGLIRGSVAPAYQAAQKAGVRRLIYLSSMIVHTSAPALGTTESTEPIETQPGFPTHIAKVDGERKLLRLRQKGAVEIVIFRPGIVFGPRSHWVIDLANQLSQGTAYFISEGKGICNSVYIDNLIHAIRLAMTVPEADGEAFFVGDREQVTWFDFYRPFAEAFGVDPTRIPSLPVPEFTHSWRQQVIGSFWNSQFMQKVLATASEDLKQKIKSAIPKQNKPSVETFQETEAKFQPVVTEMMAKLQQSQYKLPFSKAQKILGYEPIVSFDESCRRSIEWLRESKLIPSTSRIIGNQSSLRSTDGTFF